MENGVDSETAFPSERISVATALNPEAVCVDVIVSGTEWVVHMDASKAQFNAENMLAAIAARTDKGEDAGYNCHFGERAVPMTRDAFIDFAALLLRTGASAQSENHLLTFLQEVMGFKPLEALHMVRAYRQLAARLSEQDYQRFPKSYE